MSQPAVSRHLKVLEDAGLISRRRRKTARLSRLEGEGLKDASEWLARYQALWQARHDRLAALLATLGRAGSDEPETTDDPTPAG